MANPKNIMDAYRIVSLFLRKNDKSNSGLGTKEALNKFGEELEKLVGGRYESALYPIIDFYYNSDKLDPDNRGLAEYLEQYEIGE